VDLVVSSKPVRSIYQHHDDTAKLIDIASFTRRAQSRRRGVLFYPNIHILLIIKILQSSTFPDFKTVQDSFEKVPVKMLTFQPAGYLQV